jgi:hypothetical protein
MAIPSDAARQLNNGFDNIVFSYARNVLGNNAVANMGLAASNSEATRRLATTDEKVRAKIASPDFKNEKDALLRYLGESCADSSVVLSSDLFGFYAESLTQELNELRESVAQSVVYHSESLSGAAGKLTLQAAREKLGGHIQEIISKEAIVAKPKTEVGSGEAVTAGKVPAFIIRGLAGFEALEKQIAKSMLDSQELKRVGMTAIMPRQFSEAAVKAFVDTPEFEARSKVMFKYLVDSCTDPQVVLPQIEGVLFTQALASALNQLRERLVDEVISNSASISETETLGRKEAREQLGGFLNQALSEIDAGIQKAATR